MNGDRYFEKISYKQFSVDISDDINLYNEYILPKRATINSAGYDFYAIMDVNIRSGEVKKIPTGIKAKFGNNECLFIIVRSSMGFKHNIRMCNQVGLIDADYYNNIDNEGHIWVALQNHSDRDYVIKKGEAYAQGVFLNFLTCGDIPNGERNGGLGSTNKES